MFCEKCGKELPEGSIFCTGCGANLTKGVSGAGPQNANNYINQSSVVQTPPKKKKGKGKVILGVIAIFAVIIIGIAMFGGEDGNSVSEDINVETVKGGTFIDYPDITVGDAFDDFFADIKWSSYEDNGEQYVSFKGECTYDGKPADAKMVFKVEDDRFSVESCNIGELSFNNSDISDALDIIYKEQK